MHNPPHNPLITLYKIDIYPHFSKKGSYPHFTPLLFTAFIESLTIAKLLLIESKAILHTELPSLNNYHKILNIPLFL